jgi:hypothetical protein
MGSTRLITAEEFGNLTPRRKGYAVYMLGHIPGSELQGLTNPYAQGTLECQQWNEGQALAVKECAERGHQNGVRK